RLTIKEGAGYAILVLGQLDDAAEGRAEHSQTADYIREVLIERHFDAEDIYYLRDQGAGALAPTKENLQYAIEVWARDRMLGSPAPLYVILADHGSPGVFHLDVDGTPEQESVTAPELAGYLDVLESSLGAKASAADQEIVVVYGACYSGGFVPALSGPGRVLIASCGADEISYRGVLDGQTGVRDGEFFLMEFFRTASEGRSLAQAFEAACVQTSEYTVSRSNGGVGDVPQHPLLDDNGDGFGTTGQLSSVPGEDGGMVHGLVLGLGANAGNGITWFTASPPVYLDPGDSVGVLLAETAGRLPELADTAWAEIKTPDYDNGVVAAPGYEAFQRVASMVGPIAAPEPVLMPGGHYAYQWEDALLESDPGFAGFNNPGTYKVYYFLRDSVTEQVGAYLVTNVYVSQPENMNPLPVALHYPFEDTDVYTSTFFVWGETVDPDADALSYQLEVSDDLAFPEAGTTVVMTTETMAQLTGAQSLLDLHRYYWRVIAVDEYGAQSLGNEVRTFTTNNHNPAVPGAVTGMV
ncbi:MAG: hypothetical protein GY851_23430, partial [bacterium]|nr:hypothetical protein [bacterium]